jgi:hypothetical protein
MKGWNGAFHGPPRPRPDRPMPHDARWAAVRRARDRLLALVGDDPGVRMVDIGLDEDAETLVLRVHLDPAADAPAVPAEVDGVPVRLLRADYRPEAPGGEEPGR